MVLVGFCLKIANGSHESGVAVRCIGRKRDIIIIMLKLQCKLKGKVSLATCFLETRLLICNALAIPVPSISLLFGSLQ